MDCDRLREHLVDHVDGLLGAEEAAGARAHLEVCEPCRLLREEVRRGFGAMDAWEDEVLPAGAYGRLLARLPVGPSLPVGGDAVAATPARPWLRRVVGSVIPYAAGIATAAAVLSFVFPGPPAGDPDPAIGPVAPPAAVADPGGAAPRTAAGTLLASDGVSEADGRPALRPGERRLQFRDFDNGVLRTLHLPSGLDPSKVVLVDHLEVVPEEGVR